MDILSALFGSEPKIRILRMFLFNSGTPFLVEEIAERSRCSPAVVKRELHLLLSAGILKKRLVSKEVERAKGKKTVVKKLKGAGYVLDEKFPYLDPLKNLLTVVSLKADDALAKRFAGSGKVKLFVAAGVFIQDWNSRVDLLVVGDELHLDKIESVIKNIEAEIGKEIAYSAFETPDFEYRLGIHDRLVRDILDYPHVTLLDRLGVESR